MPLDDTIPFCEFFYHSLFFMVFYIAVTVIYFTFFQGRGERILSADDQSGSGMTLFLIISGYTPMDRI